MVEKRRRDCVTLESMSAEGTWYEGAWERLALENPRSLKFLEFIDTSSWYAVLMDVAQLGTTFSLVEPGFTTVEFAW